MANEERIFLANGWTATIFHLGKTRKVIKVLDKKDYPGEKHFQRERQAYERMSQHNPPSSILKFYGVEEPLGLVFELAENGSMDAYLWGCLCSKSRPESAILYRWATQAAEALAFVHSCGIIHCDIHVANFFLDREFNLKIGDFGACAIDGGVQLMTYRRTHQLWIMKEDRWRKAISVASEIFALGSTMFNMETMRDPMQDLDHEKDRDEIARRIRENEMPSTGGLVSLGAYVKKCWKLEYSSMSDLLRDLGESNPLQDREALNLFDIQGKGE